MSVMLLPATGFAAEGKWTAEMQEDEGGSVLVASVTAKPVGDLTPALSLMCAGTEGVNLRYQTHIEGEPSAESDILLKTDKAELTRHFVYEDMDGAFAAVGDDADQCSLSGGRADGLRIVSLTGVALHRRFPLLFAGATHASE